MKVKSYFKNIVVLSLIDRKKKTERILIFVKYNFLFINVLIKLLPAKRGKKHVIIFSKKK